MANYFNLCAKIYVATSTYLERVIQLKPNELYNWETIKIGVGYQDSYGDGPIQVYETYQSGENGIFKYMIEGNTVEVPNTGVLVTYERDNTVDTVTKNLWAVNGHNREHYYENTYKINCEMFDLNDLSQGITGMIDFTCDNFRDDHDDYLYDPYPSDCAFHGESIVSPSGKRYLCFNSDDETVEEAENKTNGEAWECWIYIIDPDNPRFHEDVEIKTLQLPSVYRPFYMRLLTLINNAKIRVSLPVSTQYYPTSVYGNIYNGIGRLKNDVYEVCDFMAKVNSSTVTRQITGETPTLLCPHYDEAVHTFGKINFPFSFARRYEGRITSLNNIKFNFIAKEKEPEGYYYDDVFKINTLDYTNEISFYEINYTTGFTTSDNIDYYQITFDNNSFKGNSSENVKYFMVSKSFCDAFLDTSKNILCNKKQSKELNPQGGLGVHDPEFLSFYDVYYYSTFEDYNQGPHYFHKYEAILINPSDYAAAYEGVTYTFRQYDEGWAVIGIIDPLVNLLNISEEKFLAEKDYGTVLAPHKDFVTIMTYKKYES